jgi:hypothetical protein
MTAKQKQLLWDLRSKGGRDIEFLSFVNKQRPSELRKIADQLQGHGMIEIDEQDGLNWYLALTATGREWLNRH